MKDCLCSHLANEHVIQEEYAGDSLKPTTVWLGYCAWCTCKLYEEQGGEWEEGGES